MIHLNWRCCAKNLKRYKKSVRILFRSKCDNEIINAGTYWSDTKDIGYYDCCGSETIKNDRFKNYEYVTLGEL